MPARKLLATAGLASLLSISPVNSEQLKNPTETVSVDSKVEHLFGHKKPDIDLYKLIVDVEKFKPYLREMGYDKTMSMVGRELDKISVYNLTQLEQEDKIVLSTTYHNFAAVLIQKEEDNPYSLDRAELFFKRAIALEPEDIMSYGTLIELYMYRYDYLNALAVIDKYIKNNPNSHRLDKTRKSVIRLIQEFI